LHEAEKIVEGLRDTGIKAIGRVPWGTHFCQFYRSKQDLIDILVPYFKSGLEGNEMCMWVTSAPLTKSQARQAIAKAVPGVERRLESGQLEILSHTEWYLKGGSFVLDRVLAGWVDRVGKATAAGYSGLRVTGNTAWLEKKDWKSFTQYETAINGVIGKYPMLALCTYSLEACGAAEVMDVVHNHEFALIKQENQWELIESSLYKQTKNALQESERQYRRLIESIQEGIWAIDKDERTTFVNPRMAEMLGYRVEEMLGRHFFDFIDDSRKALARERMQRRRQGIREQVEFELRRKDGRPILVALHSAPLLDENGVYVGAFAAVEDITEKKQAEELLKYQAGLIDSVSDAVYSTDAELKIRSWNHAAELMYGWKAEEAIGREVRELLQSEFRAGSREQALSELFAQGAWSGEILQTKKDGTRIPVLTSRSVLKSSAGEVTGVVAIARDITERIRAEEALRETHDYLENLLDYANAPIIVWNPQFKITRFNHAFEHLTGLEAARVLGQKLDILFPQDSREESLAHIRDALAGQRWEAVEIPILRRDGSVRIVLWNSATLFAPEGGQAVATIAQGQDITERNEAEKELRRKTEELARSNAELEQFAYVASHDLQEPLRMVSSYVQLLADRYRGKLDPDADEFIHFAHDGAVRMQRLIHDLLTYSRVGTHGAALEELEAEAVLAQAGENLKLTIEENGVVLTHDPLPVILADRVMLTQVFQNLIDNAVKFRREERPKIHVSCRRKGEEWVFSVRDNGIGIEPEYYERIFVIFQKLHSKGKYQGTGIGLALCRRAVEKMGGRIWAESKLGEGSTFFFTLPAAGRKEQDER
jgi:PAS domain S-box-containing protein